MSFPLWNRPVLDTTPRIPILRGKLGPTQFDLSLGTLCGLWNTRFLQYCAQNHPSGGSSLQLCSIVEQDSRRREEHNDRLDGFMLNMSKIDAVSLENNSLFNFQLVSQWFSVPTIMCRRSLTILIPDCQCKVIIIPLSLRTNLPTINSIDCHVCSWSRSNIFWWVLWRLKMHRNYRSDSKSNRFRVVHIDMDPFQVPSCSFHSLPWDFCCQKLVTPWLPGVNDSPNGLLSTYSATGLPVD